MGLREILVHPRPAQDRPSPEAERPRGLCPQCRAEVPLDGAQPFTRCPHCRASLWADLSGVLQHSVLKARLGAGEARGALERYLRGAEVDPPAGESRVRLEYHPWYVIPRGLDPRTGDDAPALVSATHDAEFLTAPRRAAEAGDGDPPSRGEVPADAWIAPALGPDEARAQVPGAATGASPGGMRLVHVPVWRIDYAEGGRRWHAHVDAVEGDVSALMLPPASSRRMDRTATLWCAGAIGLFALEAAVLPGLLLPLVAFAVTGGVAVLLVRRGEAGRR